MKKLSFIFAAVVAAMMVGCNNGTPSANLKDDVDTLSYVMGMVNSQGLKYHLVNRMGVDSTYFDEFFRGLNDGANAGDDKKKAAYYAGIQIGQQVSKQMLEGINRELFGEDSTQTISLKNFLAGFVSATTEKGTLMTMDEAMQLADRKMSEIKAQQMSKKYGDWKEKNEKYFAALAKNSEYKALTDSIGTIYYQVIDEGKGEVPYSMSAVNVKYEGKDIDGNIFDSSYQRDDEAVKMRCNQVIPGWTLALTHMPAGSKWKVIIPAELAYGEREAGTIKPYSVLEFIIELVSVEKEN